MIPEWVVTADVTDRAKVIYCLIGLHADANTGRAHPSRKRLAAAVGCSVDTVDRAIRELVQLGALSSEPRYVEREGDDGKRQTSNQYIVFRVPPGGRRSAAHEGGESEADPGRESAAPGTRPRKELEPQEPEDSEQSALVELPKMVDRKVVSWKDANQAADVLRVWNELTGQSLRSTDWLKKIVMRIREYPEATVDDHRLIIQAALADPWWKGPPSPSVVYGSGAQFERSIQAVNAKARSEGRIEKIVQLVTERRSA
jgi:hypothetical protein